DRHVAGDHRGGVAVDEGDPGVADVARVGVGGGVAENGGDVLDCRTQGHGRGAASYRGRRGEEEPGVVGAGVLPQHVDGEGGGRRGAPAIRQGDGDDVRPRGDVRDAAQGPAVRVEAVRGREAVVRQRQVGRQARLDRTAVEGEGGRGRERVADHVG